MHVLEIQLLLDFTMTQPEAMVICPSLLDYKFLCSKDSVPYQFSYSVMSDVLRPHELQHTRLPYPSLSPGVCLNSCPLRRWCHPTISSSVAPFSSCLQSFPAFFLNELALWIRWPKYWSFSFSISPSSEYSSWFPLELTGLISLKSKGLSKVFSSTTVWKHLFSAQPSTSVNDYWENHSFDYADLCQQSEVSAVLSAF